MIPKSGHRFSKKIMLKQKPEARGRFNLKPFRFKEAPLPPENHLFQSLSGSNASLRYSCSRSDLDELAPKRLELLHELLSAVTKIALLTNPKNPAIFKQDTKGVEEAARALGQQIVAIATAVQQRASALIVGSDALFVSSRSEIAALALRHSIPTISSERQEAVVGDRMSYGTNFVDTYRQAGIYAGRVLKGEKPADLPVEQPTKFELIVNLKTAKALGLKIPESFLLRADEVIE